MGLKSRLTIVSFMQFFVWGAWLTTLATYGFKYKAWSPEEFGVVFSTLGIASIIMPPIVGIIADKWMNVERLYGLLHILYGIVLFFIPSITEASTFFYVMLLAMFFYMPTISLSNALSYSLLTQNKLDPIKDFPPIRVFGTIGFIVAMWFTNFFSKPDAGGVFTKSIAETIGAWTGHGVIANQFYFAAVGAVFLGIYAIALPPCPPQKLMNPNASWSEKLGLNAFALFKNYKMAIFFIFSMFLGAALQLTNMFGDTYIDDFRNVPEYADAFAVKYSTAIISISQISETLFIISIPFFLKRFGIKHVILMSMFAWVLRFGLFSLGAPVGLGLVLIILSNIVYGMAFDFFNISGSLFVETNTDAKMRSSAQGLFMMMGNGFGAILGSLGSGWLINKFFLDEAGHNKWPEIWMTFAIYALVIAVLFAILFKHKHNPQGNLEIKH